MFSSTGNRCASLHDEWGTCQNTARSLAVAVLMAWWAGPTLQTANAQSGGEYSIKKSTVDSGGGTVTGGAYAVTGTVGQSDTGDLSGGAYAVTGGFWSPSQQVDIPPGLGIDPTGIGKTRFVSFSVPGANRRGTDSSAAAAGETALRVKLVSLHHVSPPYTGGASVPFTSFEGQARWVGPPAQYVESSSTGTPFYASVLQCAPHYQDWSTVGLLHVTGSAIVPSSIYDVENVAASCAGVEASCTAVSAPLSISTTRWADVEQPYNPPATSDQPDTGDISALVNKFKSAAGAPIKARGLIAGNDAFGNITTLNVDLGFGHISACVNAFRGAAYPYTIASCP